MSVIENQTLALAGIFQSAALIEQLAYQGKLNQAAYDCSLDSLFTFDAPTAIDVFGDLAGLSRGLRAAAQYLSGDNQQSGKNVAYYVLSMLKISQGLKRNQKMADAILTGLQAIATRADEFDMSRASLDSKIDGLYQDTVSTISPRILVKGEQIHLTNPDNASKIRVLLLAGIRAAVLWHQLGGSKWKLVISRKKYVRSANQILMRI
jgi:high frequency lysogenization protein